MTADIRPIRSEIDYEAALAEIEKLWGAKGGTPEGDRWAISRVSRVASDDQYWTIF